MLLSFEIENYSEFQREKGFFYEKYEVNLLFFCSINKLKYRKINKNYSINNENLINTKNINIRRL